VSGSSAVDHIVYSVSKKNPPPPEVMTFFHFFHKRLRIFNRFFTRLLRVLIFARLQIFVHNYLQLLHIKRDWLVHVKNRRPYNLYCVGGDVKPCSINQSRKVLKMSTIGQNACVKTFV